MQTYLQAEPPRAGTLRVIGHSMVAEALGTLRNRHSSAVEFRVAAHGIARALAYEATRDLPLESVTIETPMESTTAARVAARVVAVPVLRAGLAMLPAFQEVVPAAATGFVGLRRDERTLQPYEYYRNLPDLQGAHLFLLDPMLATGGSILAALRALPAGAAASISVLSIIAAPEGTDAVAAEFPEVQLHVAALDRCLNEHGFILPGLGDAGDRLCQTL